MSEIDLRHSKDCVRYGLNTPNCENKTKILGEEIETNFDDTPVVLPGGFYKPGSGDL